MRQKALRIIPVGYGNKEHRVIIEQVMASDPAALLVDIRKSPKTAFRPWNRAPLRAKYGERYLWLGDVLGNENYNNDGPIAIVDLETGMQALQRLLLQGHTILLLCGCASYAECHRRTVAMALYNAWPNEIEIAIPERLISQQESLEALRQDRESLEQKLAHQDESESPPDNEKLPALTKYWSLTPDEKTKFRQGYGFRR